MGDLVFRIVSIVVALVAIGVISSVAQARQRYREMENELQEMIREWR